MEKNGIGIIVLATAVGVAPCFGESKYHVQQREYTPEPQLTTMESFSTATTSIIPADNSFEFDK